MCACTGARRRARTRGWPDAPIIEAIAQLLDPRGDLVEQDRLLAAVALENKHAAHASITDGTGTGRARPKRSGIADEAQDRGARGVGRTVLSHVLRVRDLMMDGD